MGSSSGRKRRSFTGKAGVATKRKYRALTGFTKETLRVTRDFMKSPAPLLKTPKFQDLPHTGNGIMIPYPVNGFNRTLFIDAAHPTIRATLQVGQTLRVSR